MREVTKFKRKHSAIIIAFTLFVLFIATALIAINPVSKAWASASETPAETITNAKHVPTITDDFKDDRVIVTLKQSYSKINGEVHIEDFGVSTEKVKAAKITDLFRIENEENAKKVKDGDLFQILSVELQTKGKESVLEAIAELGKSDMVLAAEPDYNYAVDFCQTSNDPFYNGVTIGGVTRSQWGLTGANGIQSSLAWDITKGSANVRVGIMEAGFDKNHEDLAGRVLTLPGGYTPPMFTNLEHGTHVASIVGAVANNGKGVAGVAQVSLIALNINDFVGSLEFAQNNNIWIINASFGYTIKNSSGVVIGHAPYDTNHAQAIYNYGLLGGILVCAAGNGIGGVAQNLDTNPLYPASYSSYTIAAGSGQPARPITNVISVGSINESGARSSFSNYGLNGVQIFAPGENIISTYPADICANDIVFLDGTRFCEFSQENRDYLESLIPDTIPDWNTLIQNFTTYFGVQPAQFKTTTHCANGYHAMSGTSMAAPYATGVAALLRSVDSTLTAVQVRDAIINNGIPININVSGGTQATRRLNAFKAVSSVAYTLTNVGTNNIRIDSLKANLKTSITGSLTIPDTINGRTVTEIGSSVFANSICNEITIPASVTSIGQSAFAGTALNTLNMLSANPPTLGSNIFNTVPISIYVPNWNSLASYNASSEWHNYVIMGNVRVNASAQAPVGYLDVSTPTRLAGWIYNSRVPQMSIAVHVLVYNAVTNAYLTTWVIEANQYRPDVQAAGYGTGMYGFDFTIPTTYNYGIKMNLHAITGTGYHPVFGTGTKNTTNVTFDKQGGSSGTNSVLAGLNLSMPSATAPTRAGYTFGGYWTGIGGTGTQYYNANMGSVRNWNITSGETTLYARWTPIQYYFTQYADSLNDPIANAPTIELKTYDQSFEITASSISGYTFQYWEVNGQQYTSQTITLINLTTVAYAYTSATAWYNKSCIAEGTLITLVDGSQVAVEDLTGEEFLLVWNLFTGTFDVAPILFIDSDPYTEYEIIHLYFSDGTEVKVISEHGFWDITLNEYVFLRNDAAQYIGHWFNKQTIDGNGNMVWTAVQLADVDIYSEYTTAWSPVTFGHLCYYVNGMLSMPGATEGLINIFEVDATTMQYDAASFAADIATYGLYTYEEFAEIIPIPEVIFEAFNGQYLKVSIGKGLITMEGLIALIERYADFFTEEDDNTPDVQDDQHGHGNHNGQGNGNHHGHNNGNGNHNGHRRRGR